MYTLCATEKTARQQRQFEQTFLQMLLESHYDSITISELCRRAGLSRKIFYRLFEKKTDVLYSLIDHTVLSSAQFFPNETMGPRELHPFLNFWIQQKDLLDALLKHHNSALLPERAIYFSLNEDLSLAHSFGADTGKFSVETMVFYMAGVFSLILAWHGQQFCHSIDEMAALMIEILTSAPLKHYQPNKKQPL